MAGTGLVCGSCGVEGGAWNPGLSCGDWLFGPGRFRLLNDPGDDAGPGWYGEGPGCCGGWYPWEGPGSANPIGPGICPPPAPNSVGENQNAGFLDYQKLNRIKNSN